MYKGLAQAWQGVGTRRMSSYPSLCPTSPGSPEAILSHPCVPATDLWGLWCTGKDSAEGCMIFVGKMHHAETGRKVCEAVNLLMGSCENCEAAGPSQPLSQPQTPCVHMQNARFLAQ